MKRLTFFILLFLMIHAVPSEAEDFLGAPVVPAGRTIIKTDSRLEMFAGLSHDQVLRFYEEALKGYKDIKYRDWEDATYIEDDGNRPWHSITISKQDDVEGTSVVIMKDNWTWIIGTLVLRYIGVFVVLIFLLLGMTLSGAIISRAVKKSPSEKK
jgi:hypothetical protein